ncbi:MAG: hypothetical protein BWY18_00026 [Candidatus Cloacimonetes bacterium ADurb.Bin211]|nr:MAG: hypothetical protein BWY18_00026 [Candidatus Cloacimonetes bacterium ADurb.Bin211]
MAVFIRRSPNIQDSLVDIFKEMSFKPGKRVFIKPNLCGRVPIKPGENTSIHFMDALIEVLCAEGTQVTIGHGSLLGSDEHQTTFEETLSQSGFSKYCELPNVRVLNLDELDKQEVVLDGVTFHLPISYFENEVDTYVNLAKLKTHMETDVSLSLKNQMGLPIPVDRINMHRLGLSKYIALLGSVIKPDLCIIESDPAMENNGPHHGTPRQVDLIAVSNDMVEIDSLICWLIGLDPNQVDHIRIASEIGIGSLCDIGTREKYSQFAIKDFRLASKKIRFGRMIYAFPNYSCSRCINAVNNAGKVLKKYPVKYRRVLVQSIISRKPINIIFGSTSETGFNSKHTNILIGRCTRELASKLNTEYLDKCPPSQSDVVAYLIDNLKNRRE